MHEKMTQENQALPAAVTAGNRNFKAMNMHQTHKGGGGGDMLKDTF